MARYRWAATMCLAAVVGGLAVGCDSPEQGTPTPGTSGSSGTSSQTSGSQEPVTTTSLPDAGVPKVADPLDATKFLADPCGSLTSAQTAQLKVGPGKRNDDAFGTGCTWLNPQTTASVTVHFMSKFREGLSGVYRSHDSGKYPVFRPVADVSGFPAVIVGNQDGGSAGICSMFIGLSDDLATLLSVKQSVDKVETVDPCEVTEAVAPLVLQTMKAGA